MNTPCINWPGICRPDGRPMIGDKYVYRLVYEQCFGPLMAEQVLHHLCHNPSCINPAHLAAMYQGQHLKEHGLTGDWGQRFKTHCPSGHPYDETNTYSYRNERHCKTCKRAAKLRYLKNYRNKT